MSAPIMPVFVGDLLKDTAHLSAEEFGCYSRILFFTWANGNQPYPDDDARLARVAGVPKRRWEDKIRPTLAPFFDLSAGTWSQKRLTKEWNFVAERAAISRDNGAKGGRPKSNKNNEARNPAGSVQVTRSESTHTHTHTQQEEVPTDTSSLFGESEQRNLSDSVESDFAIWWEHVPNKKAKDGALTCYRRARKRATAQALLAGIQRYAASVAGKDRKYIAHPTTWLNEGRWKDEEAGPSDQTVIDISTAARARIAARWGGGAQANG